MCAYRVAVRRPAVKDLDRLPDDVHLRVLDAIHALEANPRPPGARKLRDTEGYRVRVGDYRIVYYVDDRDRRVEVHRVRHRRDAYRDI